MDLRTRNSKGTSSGESSSRDIGLCDEPQVLLLDRRGRLSLLKGKLLGNLRETGHEVVGIEWDGREGLVEYERTVGEECLIKFLAVGSRNDVYTKLAITNYG